MRARSYCLVVHNSDEVKAVFIADSEEDIIKFIMNTSYGQDIENRSLGYYNDLKRDEAEEKGEGWVDLEELPDDAVTKELIERLYHDGDSEDGYTWFDTEFPNNTVKFFKYH